LSTQHDTYIFLHCQIPSKSKCEGIENNKGWIKKKLESEWYQEIKFYDKK